MISFGIDIGTTTVRATAVDIRVGNFASREVRALGRSLCTLTPYHADGSIEAETVLAQLKAWVTKEKFPSPDLGTLLFTGEAQRAPNCGLLSERISAHWEGLLSAQLNPHLESVLAAYGSGAVALSARRLGTPVLHIDIGGGTSNMAWIENGVVRETACLDLGARKWVLDPATGKILRRARVTPKIEARLGALFPRERFDVAAAEKVAMQLAEWILFPQWDSPFVVAALSHPTPTVGAILSLSGGVVDCLHAPAQNPFAYGDIGPLLAKALKKIAQEKGLEIFLSYETGRATALGVSAFSFQISGGSIHTEGTTSLRNVPLYSWESFLSGYEPASQLAVYLPEPLINLELTINQIRQRVQKPGGPQKVVVLLHENLGKALGYVLAKSWEGERPEFLILDEIDLRETSQNSPVRTLDIRPLKDSGRYAVTVKAIQLF